MTPSLKLVHPPTQHLPLATGACAVTVMAKGSTVASSLEVYDGQGNLVLRYEPELGQVHLGTSGAGLTVNPHTGDACLRAQGKLTLQAQDVEILGERTVQLGVRSALGQLGASMLVSAQRLAFVAKRSDTRVEREHRQVQHSVTDAQSVSVRAEHLVQHAGKLETVVGTMLTKAKEAFAYVEGESRVEANRATWKVAQTLWFRSKRAFLKADKDVNIDGEKVNLG